MNIQSTNILTAKIYELIEHYPIYTCLKTKQGNELICISFIYHLIFNVRMKYFS